MDVQTKNELQSQKNRLTAYQQAYAQRIVFGRKRCE